MMKRVFSILGNLGLGISLLGLLVVFVVLPLYGVSLAMVLSESMTPVLEMGGVIGFQKVDFSAVKVNDIIVFKLSGQDISVTHRVIEKIETEEGIGFKTKGDANEEPDPWIVRKGDFLGKVVFHIPWIGYANMLLRTRLGFFLVMGLPSAVALILILRDIWSKPKRTGRAEWRAKPDKFPAYLCLTVGLILVGVLWGMMVQNNQEKTLDSFARESQDPTQPAFLSEREVRNKGAFPLVISFFSEDEGVKFSQAYFWLSPGEQKSVKITGDSGEAKIKSGALLPLLPQETLYQLFCWNSQLGPLLIAGIPILPLTLIAFLVFWRVASKKPSLAERARQMKRRLSHG
jgi:signal peptidase